MNNSPTSLWVLTAAQLRDRVASSRPTPGGGSVSIVTATLGVALIQKGIVVSLKRASADLARHERLSDLRSKTSALMVSLSEFADADSLAFQRYLEACALPSTTEHEKKFRQAARQAGLVRATQIPLEAAAEIGRGLTFAEGAAGLVDVQVRSEVLAGGVMLRASIKSVLLSVDANLPGVTDATLRDALKVQRNELEREYALPETIVR